MDNEVAENVFLYQMVLWLLIFFPENAFFFPPL